MFGQFNIMVQNARRNNTESIVRPAADSSVPSSNGHKSESLIAREIRETKEKEEELKRTTEEMWHASRCQCVIDHCNK